MIDGQTQYQIGIELGQRGGWLINESGLYSLILQSKLPKAKEFKRWVTHEVIPSIRKTGSYSIQKPVSLTPLDAVNQVIAISEKLLEINALQKGIALAHAIDIVEPFYGNTLEPVRNILPPAEHETGYLNATQIGERLGGVKPRMTNMLLAEAGLQFKDDKNWRLTENGKAYGEELPYTCNGYQIRWNESVMSLLNHKESRC